MKRLFFLFLPVVFFIILYGCSKKGDSSPVGPETQGTPEGLYKSDGIVPWLGKNLEVTWIFSGDKLYWDMMRYTKDNPESYLSFDYESSFNYNFQTDNSFLIVNPLAVNRYLEMATMYFHYKLEGNKLTLSPGRIYTGNSNSLVGTVWSFKLTPEVNVPPIKYIYKEDKTGYILTGYQDTIKFTYSVEGNTISHEYTFYGDKISFKGNFEIKNNKLYFYNRQGEGKSEFEYENLEPLTLFKSSAISGKINDYFPINTGDSWIFYYYYAPEGSYGATYTAGNLSWKIVSTAMPDADNVVTYNVRETFKGFKIPSYMSKDTVFIGPDTAYFNITEDAYHRLTINSRLTQLGQVTINRYYTENTSDPVKVNTFNYANHEITLNRFRGLEEWIIGMSSNTDMSGVLKTLSFITAK